MAQSSNYDQSKQRILNSNKRETSVNQKERYQRMDIHDKENMLEKIKTSEQKNH